jgi:hypothetical protein
MRFALTIALLLAGCDGGDGGTDGGITPGMDSGTSGEFDAGCAGRIEICGDFMDQNCDGRDTGCGDNDNDNIEACRAGQAPPQCDCDDANPSVYPPFMGTPGGLEQCDGLDNDCNGRVDESAECCAGCAGMETRGDVCSTSGACTCSTNAGQALCASGDSCCASGCTNTDADLDNCGRCGVQCTNGADNCSAGECRCGDQPPCDKNRTCTAGACG